MTTHTLDVPSPWVQRFSPLLAPGARVLDLACGSGRHARWLAARACPVVAVDRDQEALSGLRGVAGVSVLVADLEGAPWPFREREFDGIVVTNYLHRPLFRHILESLNDRGVLIYETFMAGNERYGKPSRPEFLLQSGELLELCRGTLDVVAFEQGYADQPKPALLQRLAAVKPDFADLRSI